MIKKFMAIAAVAAMLIACGPDEDPVGPNPNDKPGTENPEPEPEPEPEPDCAIVLDGEFDDWDAVECVTATLPEAGEGATIAQPALKEFRLYADEMYICVYLEFDPRGEWDEVLGQYSGVRYLDLFFDNDNDPATGRLYNWSTCAGIMMQGAFYGTTEAYNPEISLYTGVDGQPDWAWEDLGIYGAINAIQPVVVSEGVAKVEIQMMRELLSFDMADTIGVGANIETEDWKSIGHLPQNTMEVAATDGTPAMLYIALP